MDLQHPICLTCGVQYEPDVDRCHCKICEDERQYVGIGGQQWTSLAELQADHEAEIREEVAGLWGVGASPGIAIGQRALLVPGDGGTVMWDCVPYLDDAAVEQVRDLGGLAAIAISHPHYYGSIIEWSKAFGDIPVYVHANDAQWLARRDNVVLWEGQRQEILPGRTLLNAGVHFAGGTVMHWAGGGGGKGALCTGDIFTVTADRRWVSFMYSYPNLIPEHPDTIRKAVAMVRPYAFESVHGFQWGRIIRSDGHAAVRRSAERYLSHLGLPGLAD